MTAPDEPLNSFGATVIATSHEPNLMPNVTVRDRYGRDVELIWTGEMPALLTKVIVTVYAKEDE